MKNNTISNNPAFYDRLYVGAWRDYSGFAPSVKARYRVIMKLLKKYRMHGVVNDVGCGRGTFLALIKMKMRDRFTKFLGSDFSEEAIRLAREKHSDIDFNVIDLRTPPEETLIDSSDVVLCLEVLEHIDEDESAIQTMYKMLKDGGYLLISVPYLLKYWTKHDDFSGHKRRYEPREMQDKLRKNGFIVIEAFAWGAIIYEAYYRILERSDPERVMANPNWVSAVASNILYSLFKLEDLFRWLPNGRRLFVVARKP